MAKRIQFNRHGGPEVLEYSDYQPAAPGPHEVRVQNKAIGLNFIDTYFRSGLYTPPALPSSLGTEGAGVVEAVGSAVEGFAVGDRVARPMSSRAVRRFCSTRPPVAWAPSPASGPRPWASS